MTSDPFGLAARQAATRGTCPVWELDDFYANHWDFWSLCSDFACAECVATPEDMGFDDRDPATEPGGDLDIPF